MVIKNTLSGKIETFYPMGEEVKIYVCGITPYDYAHLGHARSLISFDFIVRYLRKKFGKVKFVRNFTDIDDKIIERAKEEGITPQEVAEKYIKSFKEDEAKVGNLQPDIEPRVTENIEDIINLIEKILKRGYAYVSGGNVYFSVEKFSSYGKLSKRSIHELLAGVGLEERGKEVEPGKRFSLDFALWKEDKKFGFKSPWGMGRPGWHIECSTMSMKYLGETFDIHGGGQDLIFPHHENEIAQSEAATGKEFARFWIHTGKLLIRGEKMSKSLKNVINIKDLDYHRETIRFFILRHHYSSPIDFIDLKEDEKTLTNFYSTILQDLFSIKPKKEELDYYKGDEFIFEFDKILDDDFATPSAISFVFSKFEEIRKNGKREEFLKFLKFLKYVHSIFGFFGGINELGEEDFIEECVRMRARKAGFSPEEIDKLVIQRNILRKEKKFEEADKIRKKLIEIGIYLQDTKYGTLKIPL